MSNSLPQHPRLFVVGDISSSEFGAARDWLAQHSTQINVPDMKAALQRLVSDSQDPDAMVLVQSQTGQHNRAEIDRWRHFTKAPPILLYGSWSEGETRSGYPLPGVPRLAWYNFAPRMSMAWRDWQDNKTTVFHDFRDLTDEARWLAELRKSQSDQRLSVAIVCGSADQSQPVRDALELFGHQATIVNDLDRLTGFDLVHWDDSTHSRTGRHSLSATCQAAGDTPVIASLTFPRIQECEAAFADGCVDIVAKPFQVADLIWSIQHATPQSANAKKSRHSAA
jgi:CheY-like chemotaxis protein